MQVQQFEDRAETIKEFGASESVQSQNKFLSPGSKRAAVSAMSTADFQDLLRRIEKAFEQSCREVIEESILQPQACSKWLSPDRDRYFAHIFVIMAFAHFCFLQIQKGLHDAKDVM